MKKTSSALAMTGMLLIALVFTLSSDSKGHLSLFKKAQAQQPKGIPYQSICNGDWYETLCGPGSNERCFPVACRPIM